MERWHGKVAVVTGTSSGIGRAIAELLVKHGMKVVGLARRKDRLSELEINLKDRKGKFYPITADIRKEEDILAAFQWVDSNLGGVHVVVNNAGVAGKISLLEATETEGLESVFDTNVKALLIASREGIKLMRKYKIDDGHIINVSSVAGHMSTPAPGLSPYFASKSAVSILSEGLRNELGVIKSKIRVTELCPGLTRTEIIRNNAIKTSNVIPILESEDVAESVIYVLQAPVHVMISQLHIRPTGESVEAIIKEQQNGTNGTH